MSIHPSLKSADKDKKQRSVLKRIERIKDLIGKGLWKEGDNVFGLPKLKVIKIKFKKEKVEKAAATPEAGAAAAPAAAGAASADKDKAKASKSPKDSKASK